MINSCLFDYPKFYTRCTQADTCWQGAPKSKTNPRRSLSLSPGASTNNLRHAGTGTIVNELLPCKDFKHTEDLMYDKRYQEQEI